MVTNDQRADLRVHLATCGSRPGPAGRRFHEHRHDHVEFGMVVSGEALWHFAPGRTVRLREGEGILVPSEVVHYEASTTPTVFGWVGFDAPAASFVGLPLRKRLRLNRWSTDVCSLIERIAEEMAHQPELHVQREQVLLTDLLLLLRRAASSAPNHAPVSRTTSLEAAEACLRRDLRGRLTIAQVARIHGFSLSRFEVLFTRQFGCTPKQCQQNSRLRSVQRMLRREFPPIKAVADEHGFPDAAYFCRWFKKLTGETPRAFSARVGDPTDPTDKIT